MLGRDNNHQMIARKLLERERESRTPHISINPENIRYYESYSVNETYPYDNPLHYERHKNFESSEGSVRPGYQVGSNSLELPNLQNCKKRSPYLIHRTEVISRQFLKLVNGNTFHPQNNQNLDTQSYQPSYSSVNRQQINNKTPLKDNHPSKRQTRSISLQQSQLNTYRQQSINLSDQNRNSSNNMNDNYSHERVDKYNDFKEIKKLNNCNDLRTKLLLNLENKVNRIVQNYDKHEKSFQGIQQSIKKKWAKKYDLVENTSNSSPLNQDRLENGDLNEFLMRKTNYKQRHEDRIKIQQKIKYESLWNHLYLPKIPSRLITQNPHLKDHKLSSIQSS